MKFDPTQSRLWALSELRSVEDGGAGIGFGTTRPLQSLLINARICDASGFRPNLANFTPYLFRRVIAKLRAVTHSFCKSAHNLPISASFAGWLDGFAYALNAALCVHERAILFKDRCNWQKDVCRRLRCLSDE